MFYSWMSVLKQKPHIAAIRSRRTFLWNNLPDRIRELPTDKIIITLAASSFQDTVGFFYLRQAGFEAVKTMVGGSEQLATILKPAPLYARMKKS
ncbi:MAG: hypothetical protein ACERJ1_02680 [Halodesulfovibrio sp.]|uniref:hypothetical protein n=1 Tax=Halodesulfovibrio sp. TaxID=1912772 RepID=UPI00359D6480